ncbi:DNA mismatch repair endonuclease MutL [Paenimyroides viscosum]|jgi:DNA mismatch repair protein MutL|uniref:DNA mismatch repair protein MutL n=1 Tax=Paenimyroides viscosum TaxID=2488729 RepID=A0A3P1B438_9FLAO|nr:DNA mismatch repair endonuclease MutL [Paenimyroides viscosum]RRA95761.1 DNA mismatch repair endonuclease MutL [Paenimyroides viscosum]
MSSVIRLLPDHVANQIAAGEVVQRPASVVKELLENAVDAGATAIKLVIKDAGKTLIQVIDDGKGMNEIDARMCFERHATSKISIAEDLFQLQTKGFRGEALASIAAIAHVELKSKEHISELGTHVIIEGSKIVSQEIAVVPSGTSFSVKNLFFNIPARRNFLKSDQVELRHVIDEFERVALAHNNIQFTFINNGAELFNLPSSNFRQRIVNVFGGKTNEKLVPVQETTEIVEVHGFVAKPEFAKKSRGEQFFFVNDRFIKSGYLHHAVTAAFEGLLKDGTHPSYFLYLSLPPNSIDINIHPTKTEIKFDDEQALYAILRATIKHSLGQFNVSPVLDFQKDGDLEVPYSYEGTKSNEPTVAIDTFFNPFESMKSASNLAGQMGSSFNPFESVKPKTSGSSFQSNASFQDRKHKSGGWETLYEGISDAKEIILTSANHQFDEEVITGSLFDDDASQPTNHQQSYQFQKKYIISPIKSGMIIIDQRRAHQRILYEHYMRSFTVKQNASQQLLFPLSLYYGVYEMELLKNLQDELIQMGFLFDEISNEKIVILGIPVSITESEVSIVLEDLLNDLQDDTPTNVDVLHDRIAKSLAQSLAVKTGTYLSDKEQENIVNSLFGCEDPQTSPFGKTTFITMKVEDIDKKFM